jgi:ATP/ADP translocase
MTRGGFRVQFVLWSAWSALQLVMLVGHLIEGTVWDLGGYLSVMALILGMAFLGFLLYVRHHDGHFWEQEEAQRAEWERRGRAL